MLGMPATWAFEMPVCSSQARRPGPVRPGPGLAGWRSRLSLLASAFISYVSLAPPATPAPSLLPGEVKRVLHAIADLELGVIAESALLPFPAWLGSPFVQGECSAVPPSPPWPSQAVLSLEPTAD